MKSLVRWLQIILKPFLIFFFSGIPIRTTLDNSTTVQYAGLLHQLTMKAKSTVRDIDPQNDLTFLRIRSKKHEIMVAPGKTFVFSLLLLWWILMFFKFLQACHKIICLITRYLRGNPFKDKLPDAWAFKCWYIKTAKSYFVCQGCVSLWIQLVAILNEMNWSKAACYVTGIIVPRWICPLNTDSCNN